MKRREVEVPFRHEGHRRPITRRDFLAQGLISGAAMVVAPALLLGRPGRAGAQAVCELSAGAGLIPFVCFDLAGGANVAGSNAMVGGPGGQLDFLSADGYLKLGLPADMLPSLPDQLNTELGLTFHSDSAFLRGILARTSPATRANVNGCVICSRSANDTGNNPHNPMYGIARAGADGDLVTLIGTSGSESGGKSIAPMSMIDPKLRPTKISRPEDVTGLVDTGQLVTMLGQADAAAVMSAVEEISRLKLAKTNEDLELEDRVECNFVQSTHLVATYGDPAALDPRSDPMIASIFTPEDFDDSEYSRTASMMKLVVNGYAGAGTVELGGYDYHDSTRATGERKDFIAGECMGAVLEYAALLGKQLMLYVFSDGSVSCDGQLDDSPAGRGKGIWKSDNSSTASGFILVYDPAGRPQLTSPAASQIGYFRSSGALETVATPVSDNVKLLAESIVLNYLALHDDAGRFELVLQDPGLVGAATLDSLIAFQPIC